MDNQTTIQIIAIVAGVSALLGWVLKTVIKHFIDSAVRKEEYVIELVAQGQKNTEKFTETINHNQSKMNKSIDNLAGNIEAQTEIFKQLIQK